MLGAGPLGGWDINQALHLHAVEFPVWVAETTLTGTAELEYKYVIVRELDDKRLSIVQWEHQDKNRLVKISGIQKLRIQEHFGEPDKSSIHTVLASNKSMTEHHSKHSVYCGSSTHQNSAPHVDTASNLGCAGQSSPKVLDALQLGPSLQFSRIVRSPSGNAFPSKYNVDARTILGSGMSGNVCLGTHRETGLDVAMKILTTSRLSEQQRKQMLAEIENQLKMDHPNICRLLEVYEERGCLRLVMERMRGPDLFEHWSRKRRYFECDAISCMRQVCSAVAYCHRNNVCHRDLKLENFCLEDDSENARIKMIDFGLSTVFTSLPMTGAVGTLYYCAPEVIAGRYNSKCDMWSVGVMTYILLDGNPPFYGHDDRTTFRRIKSCMYAFPRARWSLISSEAQRFISSLLVLDPNDRLDAQGALEHAWLSEAEADSRVTLEPLDPGTLQGMRTFARSNALKRAILLAVAPVATVDRVTHWASQFEMLDEQGCGTVSVGNFVSRLAQLSSSEDEATEIAACLAAGDGQEELISYSAFLAACLSTHLTFNENQCQELFQRIDVNADGYVSIEDVDAALGDVVDIEELKADLGCNQLSFDDFRWLLHRPHEGATVRGLRQLLSTCRDMQQRWRVDTLKTRVGLCSSAEEALEASRRENAAWRMWGKSAEVASDETIPEIVANSTQPTAELLEELGPNPQSTWLIATAEAKGGAADKVRKENLAWRSWHMAQSALQEE